VPEYVLDNAKEQTEQRFASLEACFDPVTVAHLERIGVSEGWSCLEIGGGGGSIGRWLGARVGPTGAVVVTDIDPRWLEKDHGPNVEVRLHNAVSDELPERHFDLIHARLVLLHLPEREQVLTKLVHALRDGGWLLIEDFDCTWLPFVTTCAPEDGAVFATALDAFHVLLESGGADVAHGRRFLPMLVEAGLVNVVVDGHMQVWPGGSPGALLHRANIEQLRPQLTSSGLMTEEDVERFYRIVEDPAFSVNSYLLVSAMGQRPPD
jgi:SAM-dependent methyltransferase